MEIKKSSKADLEGGKTLCFLMGAIVGLAVLFVGFEWGTKELKISTTEGIADILVEDEIVMTTQEEDIPPPPPPPPAQQQEQVVAEVLSIVEDTADVGQQIMMSTEDTQNAAQTQTYVAPAAVAVATVIEEEEAQQIFVIVEKQPECPGGLGAMNSFLSTNIKYPVVAQENGIFGRVTCSFVVNIDGSIVDIEVIRGVDPSLDKEAMRVISTMPKWTPGEQRGRPVRVRFTLPVQFRLNQ
jgi:protein TonB